MDESCLQYCLTDDERRHFDEKGFLIVEGALLKDRIAALTVAVDRVLAGYPSDPDQPPNSRMDASGLFYPNFVGRDPAFLEMVDWPAVFPKVWGILGWNIYLYHSHLGVNPPLPSEADRAKKTLGWHQDSGRVNQEMETHPRPRLSLKVAYFLTDMSEPGRGNFWVIPGSHLADEMTMPANGIDDPEGAMPVCVKAGDAVFFDRRLWHAASPNFSDYTRKVLFYGYGYRWLRTKDDMTIPPEAMAAGDPVRRQILGYSPCANGRFGPSDEDVPLRAWLREHRPGQAD